MNQDSLEVVHGILEHQTQMVEENIYFWITSIVLLILIIAAIGIALYQSSFSQEKSDSRLVRLKEMNEELQSVNFIFNHDLRGSADDLSYVINSLESAESEDFIELISIGKAASTNLISIIDGAKSWSKALFDSGDLILTDQDITDDVKKMVDIRTIVNPLGIIRCNKELFINAIDNIVRNGFAHNNKVNPVVSITRIDNKIIIEDNGDGMHENEIEKMFQPFQRAANSSGTGLGLAIIRGIINRHKFKLTVDSELHAGTKFIIEI